MHEIDYCMQKYILSVLLLVSTFSFGQTKIKGQVVDYDTTIPLAFANVYYQDTHTTTDWEGYFEITVTSFEKPIVVKHKGYYDKSAYAKPGTDLFLVKVVTDVVNEHRKIYTENNTNTIIRNVIENREQNEPEKVLESFEYKNYEYIQVTANPDSVATKIDTITKRYLWGGTKTKLDSTNYKFQKYIEKQHLYQTEKVNLIQHNEQGDKETVLATRMAGFSKPIYEFLGLQLVSYSVYENPFEILEITMQNPISNIGRLLYNYKLIDTVEIQGRKTFRIYFQPKKLRANKLRGLLYIDAESFAIAKAHYRIYGIVNIKADYSFNYLPEQKIWFPKKRTFFVRKGTNKEDINILGETIAFNSAMGQKVGNNVSDQVYLTIVSTPFDIEFDKKFYVKEPSVKIDIPENSFSKPDNYWRKFEKDTIDIRKLTTYNSLDSLSVASKIEERLFLGRKIINGYFPVSLVDIDLRSIVKYNGYEGFRLGLGGVTNAKLSEQYKVAFYGAYGLKDRAFKFGITPSYLVDNYSETWLSASYSDDVSEIAQTHFVTDSRRFKIYDPRPINITTFYNARKSSLFLESKILPKVNSYFGIDRNAITPLFNYTFLSDGDAYSSYTLTTAQLAFQWSPFSNFMRTPVGLLEYEKRHPKISLQLTQSIPEVLGSDFGFTKAEFKTYYEVPYLSGQKSAVLLEAGMVFGNAPLTHLYSIAPNNLNRDAILKRLTFAGKNSFETMYYNEFFSDRYWAVHFKHTFNRVNIGYNIKPEFTVATRFAWGDIEHPENHVGLPFKSLNKGFIESGVEANKIFKGLGLTAYYRYGANHLSRLDDNISLKITYYIDLGF